MNEFSLNTTELADLSFITSNQWRAIGFALRMVAVGAVAIGLAAVLTLTPAGHQVATFLADPATAGLI